MEEREAGYKNGKRQGKLKEEDVLCKYLQMKSYLG